MTSIPAFKLLNFIFATCLLAFLFFQTGKLIWGLEGSNKTILYPNLIMTYFAMVPNHTLQHFIIYPSSSTEEFWVFLFCFFFFTLYCHLHAVLPQKWLLFLWYEGWEKRKGNTKKKKKGERKRARFKSEKSRKQCQFVYNKTKSNTLNTHQSIVLEISD